MVEDLESRQDIDPLAPSDDQTFKHVQVDSQEGIIRVTLDRPPANVLSMDMMKELAGALESLEYERGIKLLVLQASGKYFSAGFELNDHLGDRAYMMIEHYRRVFEALARSTSRHWRWCSGPALGAGCLLAAACDIVLASESAKFAHPEIRGGVFNALAAAMLPRIIGRKRAFEMLMLGTHPQRGRGACAPASSPARWPTTVSRRKRRPPSSASRSRARPIVQLARRAIVGGQDLPLEDAISHAEDVYLNQLMATEDVEEGLRAVAEKRKPDWKGR